MKKNENEIFMLQYRIKRYQAMGNGTMCQTLNGKLQKLLAKQGNLVKNGEMNITQKQLYDDYIKARKLDERG